MLPILARKAVPMPNELGLAYLTHIYSDAPISQGNMHVCMHGIFASDHRLAVHDQP